MAPGGNYNPNFTISNLHTWQEAITADEVIPFRLLMKEELSMEKNGEIKEGTTPHECCKDKEATELESHVTKRAADKASDCCKDNDDKCCN